MHCVTHGDNLIILKKLCKTFLISKIFIRRTEEMIKEKLFKNSLLLFDLSNPIFFDKNVLQENYLNLRRHLDTNSDINSEGTFKAYLSFL